MNWMAIGATLVTGLIGIVTAWRFGYEEGFTRGLAKGFENGWSERRWAYTTTTSEPRDTSKS